MTKRKMLKVLNEIGSLCTCDCQRFSFIIDILNHYGLMYNCIDCKYHGKNCDTNGEWHCLKEFPPKWFKRKSKIRILLEKLNASWTTRP